MNIWRVVSNPLKNISQMGLLFPTYRKIKNVPNHQPAYNIFFFGIFCGRLMFISIGPRFLRLSVETLHSPSFTFR
jgi:hypothetical protein